MLLLYLLLVIIGAAIVIYILSRKPNYPSGPQVPLKVTAENKMPSSFDATKLDRAFLSNRAWARDCTVKPSFMIKNSEWPTFLSYAAWDSCQGCLSAIGPTESANKTFQIVGDWMRISALNGGDSSTVSTAESPNHWFNPPSNGTNDKPLEIEWFMYMDSSEWKGIPIEEGIGRYNWSAFWAFGHGDGNYSWPSGGEIDFAEWLPMFGDKYGKGVASAVHNAALQNWPPCCMDINDPVAFGPTARYMADGTRSGVLVGSPQNRVQIGGPAIDPAKIGTQAVTKPDQNGFNNWGYNLAEGAARQEYDMYLSDPSYGSENYGLAMADRISYDKVLHCYSRITTKNISIWCKPGGAIDSSESFEPAATDTNQDVDAVLSKRGYKMVFNAYADFGSNDDATSAIFADPTKGKPNTNWHQNLFFVYAAVLSTGPSRLQKDDPNYNRGVTFYMSDIKMRGGGDPIPPPPFGKDSQVAAEMAPFKPAVNAQQLCGPNFQKGDICNNRLKNAGLYS